MYLYSKDYLWPQLCLCVILLLVSHHKASVNLALSGAVQPCSCSQACLTRTSSMAVVVASMLGQFTSYCTLWLFLLSLCMSLNSSLVQPLSNLLFSAGFWAAGPGVA